MSRRKYRLPPPPPAAALPSPAEIIELAPRSGRTPAPAVTPLYGPPLLGTGSTEGGAVPAAPKVPAEAVTSEAPAAT